MIKGFFLYSFYSIYSLYFFYFLVSHTWAHDHISSATPLNETGHKHALRVFKSAGDFNFLTSYESAHIDGVDHYSHLLLGGKYRVSRNLKTGLYYERQFKGRDLKDENVAIFELSPRFLFDFLPGERWVGEFRVRYGHNFTAREKDLKIRPGLTYFYFKNGEPLANIFIQYEIYRSLNYGAQKNYAYWSYLGVLYHYSQLIKFAPYVSYARERTGWNYGVEHTFFVSGMNVLFFL